MVWRPGDLDKTRFPYARRFEEHGAEILTAV